ncbi:shikimate kinase [Trichothermofontia sp.]
MVLETETDGKPVTDTELAKRLQGINLYLIGMMGAGKSTVGHLLAQHLEYRFFDTDILIERVKQQPITEIFQQEGEASFRALETQVLAQLSAYTRSVVATGGGIVLAQHNWSYLQGGLVIWLDVPIAELAQRLEADTTRPLLTNGTNPVAKLQSLFEARSHLYAQADLHIPITPPATPEAIAAHVLAQIPTVLKPLE